MGNGEKFADDQTQLIISNVKDIDGNRIFNQADADTLLETEQTEFVQLIMNTLGEMVKQHGDAAKNLKKPSETTQTPRTLDG